MSRPDLSFLFQNWTPDEPEPEQPLAGDDPLTLRAPKRPRDPMDDLVNELRNYQFELETQNKVLRFSQASAESASERFEALFASVPLALMVIDEHDMVVQANSMAHRSFQPTERDPHLISLMPFVSDADAERVRRAFLTARTQGRADTSEVVFNIGENARMTGDLHIACIETQ